MRNISCYGIFSLRGSLEAKTLQMYSKFWFQEAANFFTRLPEHQCVSHFYCSYFVSLSLSLSLSIGKQYFQSFVGAEPPPESREDVVAAAAVIPELPLQPTRPELGWHSTQL